MKLLMLIMILMGLNFAQAGELNLEQHKGKVIYLDFWASWCGPCKESFPWLNKMKNKYPNLKIIAVNLDKKRIDADNFLKKYPADFEIVYNPDGQLAEKYKVKGMPYSIIIDKKGNKKFSHIGYSKDKSVKYIKEIQQLLGE